MCAGEAFNLTEDPPRWMLGAAAQGYPHDEADLEDERAEEPDLTDTEREYLDNLARPDDGPLFEQDRIITPHGIMQLIPHSMTLPDPELLDDEEQYQAAKRYVQKRYGEPVKFDLLPPEEYVRRLKAGESLTKVQADIMDHITSGISDKSKEERKATPPTYGEMIHRDPDGPDPLVEEPGP